MSTKTIKTDETGNAKQPTTGATSQGKARRRSPKKVRCSEAIQRVRLLIGDVPSIDLRRALARLGRSLARGRKKRLSEEVEESLEMVLAAAEATDPSGGRYAGCEAAAWGLAWLARSKRSAGSSGGLLQKLVRAADGCIPGLSAGDTSGAVFVFVLARLFDDVEACRRLGDVAVAAVEQELCRLMPPSGPIGLKGSEAIVGKVAEWSQLLNRAALLRGRDDSPQTPWNATAHEAFCSAVDVAIRLLGGAGRAIGRAGRLPESVSAPILEAVRGIGDKPLARTVERLVDGEVRGAGLSRDLRVENGRFAVLRTGWGPRDLRVLVDARAPMMDLEIAVGDRLLVAGPWEWKVSADGAAVTAEGPWQESCHESDDKATFLEWTLPLSHGLQLERQMVLSPEDRVLLLSDSIVPSGDRLRAAAAGEDAVRVALEYRGTWDACDGISLEHAGETREVIGFDTAVRFMALPLALPEWSAGRGCGSFEENGQRIVLTQQSAIARLHAPVWFDGDPRRIGGPLTWRQLSVADTRQNLPTHRACGYRVQAGQRQWLVYRALDAVRNRSVLGCNLACEFLLGRIGRDGMVERLIEIQ